MLVSPQVHSAPITVLSENRTRQVDSVHRTSALRNAVMDCGTRGAKTYRYLGCLIMMWAAAAPLFDGACVSRDSTCLQKKSWSLLVKAVPGPRTSSCVLSFVWWLPISLRPMLLLSASMQLLASASWTRQRRLLDCDCAEIFVIGTRNCKMGKHFHASVEKLSSLTRNWCTRHRDKVLFRAFDCNITEISISTIASASRHRRFMWRSEISLLYSEG